MDGVPRVSVHGCIGPGGPIHPCTTHLGTPPPRHTPHAPRTSALPGTPHRSRTGPYPERERTGPYPERERTGPYQKIEDRSVPKDRGPVRTNKERTGPYQ